MKRGFFFQKDGNVTEFNYQLKMNHCTQLIKKMDFICSKSVAVKMELSSLQQNTLPCTVNVKNAHALLLGLLLPFYCRLLTNGK